MTYEELVTECKRLRAAAQKAEAEFFLFLMKVEKEHEEVWSGAGCVTFDQFLKSNHIVDSDKYRFFTIGLGRVEELQKVDEKRDRGEEPGEGAKPKDVQDVARRNGAPWICAIGRQPMPEDAFREFAQRAEAFVEVEGVPPREQTVDIWRRDVLPKQGKADHRTIRRVDELSRLRAENAALKAENAALKKRLADMEIMPAIAKPATTKSKRA